MNYQKELKYYRLDGSSARWRLWSSPGPGVRGVPDPREGGGGAEGHARRGACAQGQEAHVQGRRQAAARLRDRRAEPA